jgi:hypothetical protein
MEQERQMSPNVGPTFSDMSPTCRPTRQCSVKIADADIQQTQLSQCTASGYIHPITKHSLQEILRTKAANKS